MNELWPVDYCTSQEEQAISQWNDQNNNIELLSHWLQTENYHQSLQDLQYAEKEFEIQTVSPLRAYISRQPVNEETLSRESIQDQDDLKFRITQQTLKTQSAFQNTSNHLWKQRMSYLSKIQTKNPTLPKYKVVSR